MCACGARYFNSRATTANNHTHMAPEQILHDELFTNHRHITSSRKAYSSLALECCIREVQLHATTADRGTNMAHEQILRNQRSLSYSCCLTGIATQNPVLQRRGWTTPQQVATHTHGRRPCAIAGAYNASTPNEKVGIFGMEAVNARCMQAASTTRKALC